MINFINKQYYYNKEKESYVFFIQNAPVELEKELLSEMKKAYSDWDDNPMTINEVCRKFNIPKGLFTTVKNVLGWVHSSDPFLDEEVEESTTEELVEESLHLKRLALASKFEEQKNKEVVKKAEKFDNIEEFVVKPIIDKITEKPYEPLNFNITEENNECVFVFSPTDLHVNKLPLYTEDYDEEEFKSDVIKSASNILNKVLKYGKPSEIVTVLGSDLFHVDNVINSTSKGTPQSGQLFGNFYDVMINGYNLMYNVMDIMVSTDIPNTAITVQGNHDRVLSLGLGQAIEQRYRTVKDFYVDNGREDRKYRRIGDFLLGFTHGEHLKNNQTTRNREIQSRILNDLKGNDFNPLATYFFSGHVHRSSATHFEETGIWDIVCPSLSVTDYWHYLNNYSGNARSVAGYLIHPERGLEQIIYENVI